MQTPLKMKLKKLLFLITALSFYGFAMSETPLSGEYFSILKTAVNAEFSKKIDDLHRPREFVSNAILDSISGSPQMEQDNGLVFINGCRSQSCDEKGAAFIDNTDKKLIGVAMRHFGCHYENSSESVSGKKKVTCSSQPILAIYVLRKNNKPHKEEKHIIEKFESWASAFGFSEKKVNIIKVK
jgi:hypothetical protein